MKLSMRNGVITVTGEGKTIEVETVDGELVVYGDSDVIIEELEDEEEEEEVEDEPEEPTDAFEHRTKPYDIIYGIQVGDKVRLRKDLDWEIDNVSKIGLVEELIEELEYLDSFEVEELTYKYDEHSGQDELQIRAQGWYLSTRWVEKVESIEDTEHTASVTSDIGNSDCWKLLCKEVSEEQGLVRSTRVMVLSGIGMVIQVSTQQGDNVAEALTFVPDAHKCSINY